MGVGWIDADTIIFGKRGHDHGPCNRCGFDGSVFPQRAQHQRAHGADGGNAESFGGPLLLAFTKNERWLKYMQGFKADFTQCIFHFAFDATIKNRRSCAGAKGANHHQALGTALPGGAREINHKFKIHFAKRVWRAGFFDGGAEAAIGIVGWWECGKRSEIHHLLGKFLMCGQGCLAHQRRHAGIPRVGEQLRE